MGKKKTEFPAQLVISIENEGQGEDQYFGVNMDIDGPAERGVIKRVAHYRLIGEGVVETGGAVYRQKRPRR